MLSKYNVDELRASARNMGVAVAVTGLVGLLFWRDPANSALALLVGITFLFNGSRKRGN